MKLTNDKDLKGKHVEATVRLWLWHVEGMINLSRMLVNVLYFMSGLEVLDYKLPTLQNKDELQNSSLAASSIKVLTSGPANISHDMKGLLDMSEGSPVPTILGYSNLDSLVSLGITSKDLYTQTKLEIASRIPIIQFLVGGSDHTMMLTKNIKGKGRLYVCGGNQYVELGFGNVRNKSKWTQVPLPKGFSVEKVMPGSYHNFIKGKGKDGEDKIYASGQNYYGQLALSDNQDRVQWTKVIIPSEFKLEKVITVCSNSFIQGKGENGEDKLYGSGRNGAGQLGLGDIRDRNQWTEVDVPQEFKVEEVIAGGDHNFLKGKGKNGVDKLYVSGRNGAGQLGLGDIRDRNQWTEVLLPEDFTIDNVIVGGLHNFLKGKGKGGEDKLYSTGYNKFGQLGLEDNENRRDWTEVSMPKDFTIEKVIVGYRHSFIKGKGKDGEDRLYATGRNCFGQLCLGDEENRNQWTEVRLPKEFEIEKVIAGDGCSYLKGKDVKGEEKLYACGRNDYGQLGLGNNQNTMKWRESLGKNDRLKIILRDERNRETQSKIDLINNKKAGGLGL